MGITHAQPAIAGKPQDFGIAHLIAVDYTDALAGQGIAHVFEDYARAHLDDGSLIELLVDWSPQLPSWFLYFPNRRHQSAAMSALLQHLREFDWSR